MPTMMPAALWRWQLSRRRHLLTVGAGWACWTGRLAQHRHCRCRCAWQGLTLVPISAHLELFCPP
jgi:hypothetical protein